MKNPDLELEKSLEPIARQFLEKFGFQELVVESDIDHDGDPVILARAKYRQSAPELNAEIALYVAAELNEEVARRGDDRPLILSHVHPDDEFGEDYQPKELGLRH